MPANYLSHHQDQKLEENLIFWSFSSTKRDLTFTPRTIDRFLIFRPKVFFFIFQTSNELKRLQVSLQNNQLNLNRDWKGFQCLTVRLDTFLDFLRRLKLFWDFRDCLRRLGLFDTFGDVLRLLGLFETFGDVLRLLRKQNFKPKLLLFKWSSREFPLGYS